VAEQMPEPLPAGYRLDRFLIEAELQPFGSGRVYRAVDTALTESVAVVVMAGDPKDSLTWGRFVRRFQRERQLNPGKVLDYGEWLGVPYVTVALLAGSEPAVRW
jgi:hypothetical protein